MLAQSEDTTQSTTVVSLTEVQGCKHPLCQAKCESKTPFSWHFDIQYSFGVHQVVVFFCVIGSFWSVFRWFWVLAQKSTFGFGYTFILFFPECWEMASLRWSVGLLQLHFPPWLITVVTPLVYSLSFLNTFLLDHTKMLTMKVDSETIPTHLLAYQGICWQQSHP